MVLGSTTLIDLKGPRFGAFRGSVRFVANSADETAVGGGVFGQRNDRILREGYLHDAGRAERSAHGAFALDLDGEEPGLRRVHSFRAH